LPFPNCYLSTNTVQTTLEDNTDPEDVPEVVTSSSNDPTDPDDKEKVREKEQDKNTTDADQEQTDVADADAEVEIVPENIENFCDGSYDSMGTVKDDLYVIKGSYIWKFDSTFYLADGYPMKISKIFPNLPRRFKRIDAFYEDRDEDEVVFFSGGEYITYDKRGPIYMPYNLTRYTYDPEVEKISAAMIWSWVSF
jgi:Hemopexin